MGGDDPIASRFTSASILPIANATEPYEPWGPDMDVGRLIVDLDGTISPQESTRRSHVGRFLRAGKPNAAGHGTACTIMSMV
jgi:hypothetical protein